MIGRVSILAADPSIARTGVAICDVEAELGGAELLLRPWTRRVLATISGGARADGGLRWLFLEAAGLLPIGQPWLAAVERPPPHRHGQGEAPLAAEAAALRWLDDLSRERSRVLGGRHRRLVVIRPRPGDYRPPLGLATAAPRGFSAVKSERAAWIKRQAVALAEHEMRERAIPGARLDRSEDACEALCLAVWLIRCCGPAGRWFRPSSKPIALRAVA